MICNKCGQTINDNAKFCVFCGSKVNPDSQTSDAQEVKEPIAAPEEAAAPSAPEASAVPETSISSETPFQSAVQFSDPQFMQPQNTPEAANSGNSLFSEPQTMQAQITPEAIYVPPVNAVSETAAPKPKKRKRSVAFVVLFAVLAFIFSLYAITAGSVRSILDNHCVSEAVSNANPGELTIGSLSLNTGLIDAVEKSGGDSSAIRDDMTLSELISEISGIPGLSADDVTNIIEESTIMPYIGKVVAAYEDYILTGESDKVISAQKILNLLNDNKAKIFEISHVDISNYSNDLESDLNANDKLLKSFNPANSLGSVGSITSLLLSPAMIITAAVLALACMVAAAVITRRVRTSVLWTGIVCAINGIAALAAGIALPIVVENIMLFSKQISRFIGRLIKDSISSAFIGYGAIDLGAGILFIAAYVISTYIVRRKEDKNQQF